MNSRSVIFIYRMIFAWWISNNYFIKLTYRPIFLASSCSLSTIKVLMHLALSRWVKVANILLLSIGSMRSSYNGCLFMFPIIGKAIIYAGPKGSLSCFATWMVRGVNWSWLKRCHTRVIRVKSMPCSNITFGYYLEDIDSSCIRYSSYYLSDYTYFCCSSDHIQVVRDGLFRMVASLLLDCIVIVTSLVFGMISLKTTEQLKLQLDQI